VFVRQVWRGGPHWEVSGRKPMMHEHGKSDRRVVPAKPPNTGRDQPPQGQALTSPAEAVEGSRLAKSNPHQHTMLRTQRRARMSHELERVRQAATRERKRQLTACTCSHDTGSSAGWPSPNTDTGGEFLHCLQGSKGGAACLRLRRPRQPCPKPYHVESRCGCYML
jgi:hypothetical protein